MLVTWGTRTDETSGVLVVHLCVFGFLCSQTCVSCGFDDKDLLNLHLFFSPLAFSSMLSKVH